MIVQIVRTKNKEEVPVTVGPHCFEDKDHPEDKCYTKYSSDTVRKHVATIPFGNWVIDKSPCKPCGSNIVKTGQKPLKCG